MTQPATLYNRHRFPSAIIQHAVWLYHYLQARWDAKAAKRFFRRLLRSSGKSPWKIVTDKLDSYGVARRQLMPATIHDTDHYANNRAERSHQPIRVRERGMRGFPSPEQAQRSPSVLVRLNVGTKHLQGEAGEGLLLIRCR
jgi:putative transposase